MVSTVLPPALFVPTTGHAPTPARERAWHLSARLVIPTALGVALLLSTQFLAQPFVWRNWPLDEVLLGWRDVLTARAITALAIGTALIAAGRLRVRHAGARAALLVGAIASGAAAGELLPLAFDAQATSIDLQLAVGRLLQTTLVGCSVAAMVSLWLRSAAARAAAQDAELRRSRTEQQLAQLRLQVLRSRIEPHFLFNTLATVRRLHQTDPAQGRQLLGHFVAYLRWTRVSAEVQHIRLGQEVDLVHAYLSVVATRMSGRLTLRSDVPDALRDCAVPPLVLATLAENAVKHGIASMPEGGTIEVRAQALDAGTLELTVADTGAGLSGSGGTGIGLANVRARLATLYGDAASLGLEHNPPHGVLARVRLPLRRAP
jgi:signal transduction histidine kinase